MLKMKSSQVPMQNLDILVTQSINGLSGHVGLLDLVMVTVTKIGVPLLILAVVASWWVGTNARSDRHIAVASALSFAISLALNQIILLMVHRVRPYDAGVTHLLIARSADPSFPSDHATATFAVVFAYLLALRFSKAFWFFLMALLIVFTRVYVGTHYVTDILGGIATAFIGAAAVRIAYREDTRIDRWVTHIL
jgi:undecaprenyl-diphosphatase